MDLLKRIQRFDAYPKTVEDFRIRTTTGATISIVSALFISWLFISEFVYYMRVDVNPQLFVDTTRGEKLKINIDITFPHLSCAFLTVDAMDITGSQQLDISTNLYRTRLDLTGRQLGSEKQNVGDSAALTVSGQTSDDYCGSCYGAGNQKCCNTCQEVREAYRKAGWAFTNPDGIEQCAREGLSEKIKQQQDEGCRVHGFLEVNKIAGNVHFAPGVSFQQNHMHVHDMEMYKPAGGFNTSHVITKMSFGDDYPGVINPLDGVKHVVSQFGQASVMYSYYLKVVPTIYESLDGNIIKTNQFSVTEHQKNMGGDSHGLPGVFFMYDLSPIMVKFTETKKSFAHFLTGVCAIIGGVFTVAGLIDSFLYHGLRSMQKKIELGKHN
jgi:hypothetical protein